MHCWCAAAIFQLANLSSLDSNEKAFIFHRVIVCPGGRLARYLLVCQTPGRIGIGKAVVKRRYNDRLIIAVSFLHVGQQICEKGIIAQIRRYVTPEAHYDIRMVKFTLPTFLEVIGCCFQVLYSKDWAYGGYGLFIELMPIVCHRIRLDSVGHGTMTNE